MNLSPDVNVYITIRASRWWLNILCDILINNAIQALEDIHVAKQPHLIVQTRLEDGYVNLVVVNNGPPIPVAVQAKLFREPIPKEGGERGAGIGLLQAQAIVQTYGGTINHDAGYDEGARFIIQFPMEDSGEGQ